MLVSIGYDYQDVVSDIECIKAAVCTTRDDWWSEKWGKFLIDMVYGLT